MDDSPVVRERLVELVAGVPGATLVGEAGDAASAIEGLRRHRPDVVILDVAFPGGGALKVMDALPAKDSRPAIIILTNYADPEYRERFLARGAMAFFDKVVEFPRVAQTLQALLAARRARPAG